MLSTTLRVDLPFELLPQQVNMESEIIEFFPVGQRHLHMADLLFNFLKRTDGLIQVLHGEIVTNVYIKVMEFIIPAINT